jgi:RND family efflux transporter MFP subunit
VDGLVAGVAVRVGDRVKAGQPLLQLDTELLDRDIALAEVRLAQSELRIKHAEKNYRRLEALYAEQGASEKDFDEALFTWRDLQEEKKLAGQVLARLQLQKEKSLVTAPFAGVVLEKRVETGDWVKSGDAVFRFAATETLYVRVPVAETMLKFVVPGEKVAVRVHAYDRELTGTMAEFDPVADEKTKNVFLKVRIPPQADVAENFSATVYVPASTKKRLGLIPRDALVKIQGQDFVYTIKDGKASLLPVHIVTWLGDLVAADNPHFLEEMQVVVEGNERLRPDQPVTVSGER